MENVNSSNTNVESGRTSEVSSQSLQSGSDKGYWWRMWLKQHFPVSLLDFNTNAPKPKKNKGNKGKPKKAVKGKAKKTKTKGKGKPITKEKGKTAKGGKGKKSPKGKKGGGTVTESESEKEGSKASTDTEAGEKEKGSGKDTSTETGTEGESKKGKSKKKTKGKAKKGKKGAAKGKKKGGSKTSTDTEAEEKEKKDEGGTSTETGTEGESDKKKGKGKTKGKAKKGKKGAAKGKKKKGKGGKKKTGSETETEGEGGTDSEIEKGTKKENEQEGKAAGAESGSEKQSESEKGEGKLKGKAKKGKKGSAKDKKKGKKGAAKDKKKGKKGAAKDKKKGKKGAKAKKKGKKGTGKTDSESETGSTKEVKFVDGQPEGGKAKKPKKRTSLQSLESVSSTGGPVIEHLGLIKPGGTPRFYMREGSVERGTMTDFSDNDSAKNISSSSSALSMFKRDGDKDTKMREIEGMHSRMTELHDKNLELTRAVSRSNAETAESVRQLMKSMPSKRGGPPGGGPIGTRDSSGKAGGKPSEARHVHVRVKFLRINDINTVAQQFDAEVYIEARWTEKKFHGFSMIKLADVEFDECWDPQLKILNVVGDLDMDRASMVLRYEPETVSPVLVYMWHVKGIFRERMELEHFPFDVQELSVVLSSDLPLNYVELLEEPVFDSCVNLGALQESEEWSCYRHVEFSHDVMKRETESANKHSVLVISAHAKRKLGSYFWNVGIIVFLILALTFTLLSIDPTVNDRLSIIMTLFLTTVAFKLVVKSSLPSISYLTYLDIYVVFCLVYLFLQGAESAMMLHLARFRDPPQVRSYDEIGQSCLIGFLIFFHLAFFIFIELTVLYRRRRMMLLDYTYEMKRLKRAKARHDMKNSIGSFET